MIRFDCHAHVYEQVRAVDGARYVPADAAPLRAWLNRQAEHGILGGVIVQVSFLGTDNSQMLDALAGLDRRRFAGIAVIDPQIPEAGLAELAAAGVRGIRWNLVAGAALPDLASAGTARLVDRLRAHGMHVEIQLESDRLAAFLPGLAGLGLPVVLDHLGLPRCASARDEPWLNALQDLPRRDNLFVKLSAPYRGVADPRPHLDRLRALLPEDRFVWGSDWPHTRHEDQARYEGLRPQIGLDDRDAVQRLYGLSALAG